MSLAPTSVGLPPPTSSSKRNKFIWSEDLCDFLSAIEKYNPTIPEALTKYYLEKSGMTIKDTRILKFVSLAADHLLSEIIYESKQISSLRQQTIKSIKRKQELNETLELVDLEASLNQSNIFLHRKKTKYNE